MVWSLKTISLHGGKNGRAKRLNWASHSFWRLPKLPTSPVIHSKYSGDSTYICDQSQDIFHQNCIQLWRQKIRSVHLRASDAPSGDRLSVLSTLPLKHAVMCLLSLPDWSRSVIVQCLLWDMSSRNHHTSCFEFWPFPGLYYIKQCSSNAGLQQWVTASRSPCDHKGE